MNHCQSQKNRVAVSALLLSIAIWCGCKRELDRSVEQDVDRVRSEIWKQRITSKQPLPPGWDYQVCDESDFSGLIRMGAEGWELVLSSQGRFILKRRL